MKPEVSLERQILQFLFTKTDLATSRIMPNCLNSVVSETVIKFDLMGQEGKEKVINLIKEHKLGPNDISNFDKNIVPPKRSFNQRFFDPKPVNKKEPLQAEKLIDLREKLSSTRLIRIKIALKFMGENLTYAPGAQQRARQALKDFGLKQKGIGISKDAFGDDRACLNKVGVFSKNQIDPISFEGLGLTRSEKISFFENKIAEYKKKLEILHSGTDVEL